MFKTIPVSLALLAVAVFAATFSFAAGRSQSAPTASRAAGAPGRPPDSAKDVLATVNGTPISEMDVRFAMRSGTQHKEVPARHRKNVLDVIIQQELTSQRAIELGLDADPRYQRSLHRMEAQINAFKRKELAELFRREIAGKVKISEAEAKQYFTRNAERIRTDLHVGQILMRKEGLIGQARKDIEEGKSFEEVAGKRFPRIPNATREPWDLGYMRWKQIPEPWRDVVYDLKKGEVSGVIRGPNSRFWIIKLIDKRVKPDITFESARPTIVELLKNAKAEELRAEADRELRAKATVVYVTRPIEAPEEQEQE